MKESKILAVILEPGKPPYTKKINNDLATKQKIVGGLIECVYPILHEALGDDAVMIVNEEGKIMGLQPNRYLVDEECRVYDVVCGTAIIVGSAGEDFCSLTDRQVEMYRKLYV